MNKIIRLKRLLGQIDIRQALVLSVFVFLAACASVENNSSKGDVDTENQIGKTEEAEITLATSAEELAQSSGQEERIAPVLYRGTDKLVNAPPAQQPVRFLGEDVSLNFEQAPLSEVVHAIVGDILKLDYIVDGPISGQVTLRTRNPIPRAQLLGVLESLLKANGSLLIVGSDGRYLITGSPQATQLSPGVSSPDSLQPGYSTIIVPLQYISATNMAEILRPMATESAFVRVDNSRNLMMLAGTQAQLRGWLDIVNTFDVDLLEGMSVGMFPLEHSTVEETATALNGLIAAGGQGTTANLSQVIKVIPVERLNSLLIVTPRSRYLDTVHRWITRLDVTPHSNFEKRLFVYPVQNTTAGRLAGLLNSIYSGGSGGRRGGSGQSSGTSEDFGGGAGGGGVAPGMTEQSIGSESGGKLSFSGGDTATQLLTTGIGGGSPKDSPLDDVRVVADEENNALMIYATGYQYKRIESALEQLDVVATQVLIEASIIEVALTDKLKYGLEWTFSDSLGDNYNGSGLLDLGAAGLGPVVPGFSYTVTNSIGDVSAVLNALSDDGLLNVISTPSVMVLDNHQAYIHVGQQIPVEGQQTQTDGGTITQSVDYRDTGVKLSVRPSVNAGGLVTMDIAQSVTDIGDLEESTGQRRFLERLIESRVAVRSNESVVLGGLIREKASESEAGVPFLHTLPLIGPLFGSVTKESERTELLIIITPKFLYNEVELRQLSEEMRAQVRNMELLKLGEE
jgi:general secretion pathway protein D